MREHYRHYYCSYLYKCSLPIRYVNIEYAMHYHQRLTIYIDAYICLMSRTRSCLLKVGISYAIYVFPRNALVPNSFI